MDNPNAAKVATVDEIATKLEAAGTVVVTEYRGLDVPAQAELRAAIKNAGGEFKIYKNTLTKLAAQRTGLAIDEHLTGPTALAFSYPPEGSPADPVALTKALTEFQKENAALVIKGGVMDGAAIDADDVDALSKIAPREELLAKFAGLLQAPMSQFAGLLNAMPTKLAQLTAALIEKGGAGVAQEAVAEDAPAEDAPADDVDAAGVHATDEMVEAADDAEPGVDATAEDAPAEDAPADDVPADDVDAAGVHATDEMVEAADDAEPGVDATAEDAPAEDAAAQETDAAEAATEDAAEPESTDSDDAAASDQTEEPADAVSEDTDDKED